MVMEAPPNPQCVGREFVRQYYTLLNKAPAHLHRFYNNNSSFVHGGLDAPNREIKPMVGQRQIHQRIQQLNFRDCHAKISQVDSQATLGDGVVVQVTGELSNGGQPMRRFTQTFVLAAQSPKKYYVHNDIFRYQDMLMSDEDAEHDSGRSEGEDDSEPVELPVQQPSQQPPSQAQPYYQPPLPQQHQLINSGPTPMMNPTVNGLGHVEDLTASLPNISTPNVPQTPAQSQAQPTTQSQPPVATSQSPVQATPQIAALSPPQPQPVLEESVGVQEEPADDVEEGLDSHADTEPVPSTEQPDAQPVQEEKSESTLHDVSEEPTSEAVMNEPKTYANLLKGGHTATSPTSNSSIKTVPTSPPPVQQRTDQAGQVSGPPICSVPPRPGMARTVRGGSSNVRGVGRPFTSDRQGSNRPLNSDDSDSDRRRSGATGSNSSYPDSNQLFLGNLPHHATEEELKKLFSQFGAVADLRIHSKNTNLKSGPGTKVPNYGFITFEDSASVKNVLEQRPIMFDGHQKLNVEEKKPRRPEPLGGGPRSGPGSDSGQMGRPNNGIGNNGGGRGGQSGGLSRGAGSGARGRGPSGSFSRGDGAGGQGGTRGGSMNNNGPRGGGGGFSGRRQ